ncbi:MAG: alpha/beta hydrolase [Planctomycetota bacterium]|nr:alpha/beta hydrolase [Planctomycetota bacterium]
MSYASEAVQFEGSKGRLLTGVLRSGGGKVCLVTVHGWGANRIGPNDLLVTLCKKAACAGEMSLCFDLSGRGDSQGDPSEVCVDDMMDDVTHAVGFARSKGAEKVVLFGLCSGGNAALGAVSTGAEVSHVIAVSTFPFVEISDKGAKTRKTAGFARGYLMKLFKAQTWGKLFRGAVSFKGVWRTLFGHHSKKKVSQDRKLKDARRDVLAGLQRYSGNIVHVYATADPEYEPSRTYFESEYGKRKISSGYVEIERANHNFYGIEWRETLWQTVREALSSTQR